MDERLNEELIFNGIDAETGDYFFPPLTPRQASQGVLHGRVNKKEQAALAWRAARAKGHLGVKEGVKPEVLSEAGWAVLIAEGVPKEHVEALRPLLDHRKEQVGPLYRCYSTEDKTHWKAGQSKTDWLIERNAGAGGVVDPAIVPYYILIVGSPEQIPFEFQYLLDVQYAVGRIHFDTAEEYANYANSVIAAETRRGPVRRTAAYWGPCRKGDLATELSSSLLIKPTHEWAASHAQAANNGWTNTFYEPAQSTRAQALELLGGKDTPAFLMTASHGSCLKMGAPGQREQMGALTSQDWTGKDSGVRYRDCIVAGEDIPADANLTGLIAMTFCCFGGGTPAMNEFKLKGWPEQFAEKPFLAALPKRMLSHPKGGALAVIGHIDFAWDLSFRWPTKPPQLATFQSAIERLMGGHPVGSAMEYFNSRYAELSSEVVELGKQVEAGKKLTDRELQIMNSQKDCRNYAVMGDPAVRVFFSEEPPKRRETIVVNTVTEPTPTPQPIAPPSPSSVSVTTAGFVTTIPLMDGKADREQWRAHAAEVERAIAERT